MASDPDYSKEFSRIRRILWLILGALLFGFGYRNTDFGDSSGGAVIAAASLWVGIALLPIMVIRGLIAAAERWDDIDEQARNELEFDAQNSPKDDNRH